MVGFTLDFMMDYRKDLACAISTISDWSRIGLTRGSVKTAVFLSFVKEFSINHFYFLIITKISFNSMSILFDFSFE